MQARVIAGTNPKIRFAGFADLGAIEAGLELLCGGLQNVGQA
jgi:hypothetical protein